VQGTTRITGDTLLQSNLQVNSSSLFKQNVSVLQDTFLNTLQTKGNALLQSQLTVNGSSLLNHVSVRGNASLNTLYVNGSSVFHNVSLNTIFVNSELRIGPSGSIIYDTAPEEVINIFTSKINISSLDGDNALTVKGNSSFGGTVLIGGLLTLQNDLVSYSDRRIKKNITPLVNGLDNITSIHGYRYQRIDRPDESYSIGLIAQEIEETYPELVTEIKLGEDTIKTVNYQGFTGVLLECIQELKERILHLENKILEK
jgi:hypothetical protein